MGFPAVLVQGCPLGFHGPVWGQFQKETLLVKMNYYVVGAGCLLSMAQGFPPPQPNALMTSPKLKMFAWQ